MKRIIFSICLSALIISSAPFLARAQFVKNATCPVMSGERIKEKFYVDYQGERIYLCCRNCVKAFKRHPEKYLVRLKNQEEQER